MLQGLRGAQEGQLPANSPTRRWIRAIGLAVALGVAYFLAARLSLFLLTKPDGVAVFWPAAGVATGVLIALGRDARWPVAVGTMVATIVANLTGDRTVWSSIAFAGAPHLEKNFCSSFISTTRDSRNGWRRG